MIPCADSARQATLKQEQLQQLDQIRDHTVLEVGMIVSKVYGYVRVSAM